MKKTIATIAVLISPLALASVDNYTLTLRPGFETTVFMDVNNSGTIVGNSYSPSTTNAVSGFTFTDGVFTAVTGPAGAVSINARGLSDLGSVVGFYTTIAAPNAQQIGFLISQGVYTLYPDIVLQSISPNGRYMTGLSYLTGALRGYALDRETGQEYDLGANTIVDGVTNSGLAVGSRSRQSFLFDLSSRSETPVGRQGDLYRDINSFGQIVGYRVATSGTSEGILNGSISAPNFQTLLGYPFAAAIGMNDHGDIVGYAGAEAERQLGLFVTQVPEPKALVLFLVGLATFGVVRRGFTRVLAADA